MSGILTLALGLSLSGATDSATAESNRVEIQNLKSALDASKGQADLLEQKIKVIERLRENDREDAEAAAKVTPRLQADGSGIWIRSADSSWTFRPRAVVRVGDWWDLNDANNATLDQFQLQTARLGFDATLAKKIDVKLLLDISKGNAAAVQDAYVEFKYASWLALRAGKFQVPLGWERFVSPSDLLFYDRALPSQIAPNRDVGAQVGGKLQAGTIEYALGVFTGGPDGSNVDKDVNDDKDVYGRVWFVPGKNTKNVWVEGLGLGVGGSYGYHDGVAASAASYKTSTTATSFFAWNAADTLRGAGWRIAPQLSWTTGRFWLSGEFIASSEVVYRGATTTAATFTPDSVVTTGAGKGAAYGKFKKGSTTTGLDGKRLGAKAWSANVSYVVTGEDAAASGGVKPRHPFGPDGYGALEIAARIHGLSVDDAVFTANNYADTAKSAKSALSFGGSLVWHIVKGTRIQAGWERTLFDGGATYVASYDAKGVATNALRDRKPENVLFLVTSTSF